MKELIRVQEKAFNEGAQSAINKGSAVGLIRTLGTFSPYSCMCVSLCTRIRQAILRLPTLCVSQGPAPPHASTQAWRTGRVPPAARRHSSATVGHNQPVTRRTLILPPLWAHTRGSCHTAASPLPRLLQARGFVYKCLSLSRSLPPTHLPPLHLRESPRILSGNSSGLAGSIQWARTPSSSATRMLVRSSSISTVDALVTCAKAEPTSCQQRDRHSGA